MKETALIWRAWYLFKIALVGFALLMATVAAFATERPPHNRPPDNRPPDRVTTAAEADASAVAIQGQHTDVSTHSRLSVDSPVTVGVDNGGNVLTGGSQETTQIVNIGGEGGAPLATTSVAGDDLSFDAGDSPVTIDTGGNVSKNESNFFAFSTTFPQASGCFSGTQGGGGGDGGTGFLGFHWLNNDCWMSQLAEAERSGEVQALLKCGSKKFRNAIAFEQPGKERQRYCVDFMIEAHKAEIEFMKQAVDSAVASGELATSPK